MVAVTVRLAVANEPQIIEQGTRFKPARKSSKLMMLSCLSEPTFTKHLFFKAAQATNLDLLSFGGWPKTKTTFSNESLELTVRKFTAYMGASAFQLAANGWLEE